MRFRPIAILLIVLSVFALIKHKKAEESFYENVESQNDLWVFHSIGAYDFRLPQKAVAYIGTDQQFTNKLILNLNYPDLTPAKNNRIIDKMVSNLQITLEHKKECIQGSCDDDLDMGRYDLYKAVASDGIPQTEEFGLHKLSVTLHTRPYVMYIKGDISAPDEWFSCNITATKPFCLTAYPLNKDIWVKLIFDYTLLAEHETLLSAVNEKLKEWADVK